MNKIVQDFENCRVEFRDISEDILGMMFGLGIERIQFFKEEDSAAIRYTDKQIAAAAEKLSQPPRTLLPDVGSDRRNWIRTSRDIAPSTVKNMLDTFNQMYQADLYDEVEDE